ncbi:MAG: gliding motility-associated C-terminal domain-containing protein, partial [Bacteroidota bacterium]
GSVTIGVDDTEPDLVITASNEAGQTNDTVCVQFTTERFTNIEGMAWAIEWDADVARYINQQGFNLNGVSNNIFNFESPNKLSLLYAPTSPQSAPDGTSIFEVCFEILADCGEGISTPITFVPGATPIEFVGDNQQTLTADLVNGSVTADTCLGKAVDVLSITQPSCSGDSDGAVTVEFKNTIGAVMCEWVDENGAVVSTNCNLVGVAGGMYTLTGTDEEDSIIVRTVEVRDPGEITTSPAVTDESCIDGGSIMLNVSGGTSPYSFSWTGGLGDSENLTDVVAGDYEVTITDDNSCTATAMVTVGAGKFELDPLVTPAMGSMLGSIDLRPAAAVDASYSWSNGDTGSSITDLVPDTYMVTISDNNSDCEEVRSFDVEGDVELAIGDLLDEINATYNGFGVSCNGESDGILDGMITGGCSDGPVRVFINDTEVTLPAMGLPAGTHVLRLEDACGATVEQEFMITEPDAITVGPVTDVTCPTDGMSDGSFRLPASGGVGDLSIMTAVGTVGMDGLISGVDDRPFNVIVTDDNNCQLMVEDTGLAGECGPAIFECEGSSFISPNGDGLNDRFEIPCTRFVTPNELTIYTRWGETIFEVQNYDNNWDGVDMSGADLPEGGYMWVLVTGTLGSREVTRGTVSILR